MTRRLSKAATVAGLLTALAVLPPDPAAAQSIVVNVDGPCLLGVGDARASQCAGTAYIAYPATHRIDFVAVTARGDWHFTGHQDEPDKANYSLMVDSLTRPQTGPETADGQCVMDLAEDGKTVRSLTCVASTATGVVRLRASGVVGGTGVSRRGDDQTGKDPKGGI